VNDCNLLAGFSALTPLPFDTLNAWDSLELSLKFGMKTQMAGLQSGEGRMMIDSVIWAQFISMTDTQTDRQPRCHS